MKYVIYGILVFFHFMLMTALLPFFLPVFISIDLALIAVVTIAMITKDYTAALFGLSFGLLMDLFVAPAFGLYMLYYGLVGFFAAKFFAKNKQDVVFWALVVVLIGFVFREAYFYLFYITRRIVYPASMFIKFSLLSAIVTVIVGFLWYFVILKVHELHPMRRRRQYDFQLFKYEQNQEWQDF